MDNKYVASAVRNEIQRVLDAVPSTRNNTLNVAAFSLGTLIGAGLLDRGTAETALTRAAEAIGLDQDRDCGPRGIAATINSGLTKGAQNPRHVRGRR
ncbi:hypothetical protein [Microbispora sp. H10836]|uniref:hypothetical protein n=1 Tax=Microbispora sp. H10836 TaxID=2729106 RepID=UPI0014729580|nr:hypothetical protein [Microbispora sp. H10836]